MARLPVTGVSALMCASLPSVVGRDGSAYVSSSYTNVIGRITPNSLVHTFAGNGSSAVATDGLLTLTQPLYPRPLRMGSTGALASTGDGGQATQG